MAIALAPVLFAVIGVLMYALAANAKLQEVGRLTFLAAMIALMIQLSSHVIRVG